MLVFGVTVVVGVCFGIGDDVCVDIGFGFGSNIYFVVGFLFLGSDLVCGLVFIVVLTLGLGHV